jgi:hypothetical protein
MQAGVELEVALLAVRLAQVGLEQVVVLLLMALLHP